jgi:hypothetical protein
LGFKLKDKKQGKGVFAARLRSTTADKGRQEIVFICPANPGEIE